MKQFKVIALTHRTLGLDLVGKFHVEPEMQKARFADGLDAFDIREFMFLSTCNRVEFFIRGMQDLSPDYLRRFLAHYYPAIDDVALQQAVEQARTYEGLDAIRHLFHVASSLDSLVVGEREIITQLRDAYERARDNGLSGDFIRLAINKAIETAKQVYTETEIATKPVSVVNLGYRKLLERNLDPSHRVAFIGAGQTIEAIAGNLKERNFTEVMVFNRTVEKAERLAGALNGTGDSIQHLDQHLSRFDVIVTCTGAEHAIIDPSLYRRIAQANPMRRIILDLAIPADVAPEVVQGFDVDYICIEDLKEEAKRNLKEREKEIFRCENLVEERLEEFEEVFRTRKLEMAMSGIPRIMKDIKSTALEKTFARDILAMDEKDRETLHKIVNYLEKKYIAVPMKMARQVVLDQDLKDSILE